MHLLYFEIIIRFVELTYVFQSLVTRKFRLLSFRILFKRAYDRKIVLELVNCAVKKYLFYYFLFPTLFLLYILVIIEIIEN